MRCFFQKLFIAAVVLATAASIEVAIADSYEEDPFYKKTHLFVGGDIGFSLLTSEVANELDKTGIQLDAKAMLSHSWRKFTDV